MAAYWEMAAHSAYNMFSLVQPCNCQFSFFPLRFFELEFLLIAPFPDHCLLGPSRQENMSMKSIPPQTPLFYTCSKKGVNRGIPILFF